MKDASIEIANEVETEMKDLVEHLKKAQPNIKPFLEYYQTELAKLKNELHADQTMKDVQAVLYVLNNNIDTFNNNRCAISPKF